MIKMIESQKKIINNVELCYGDVIVTKKHTFLTICDGYGRYYFIKLDFDGFIAVLDGNVYHASCTKKYSSGDRLIPDDYLTEIKDIIPKENVNITVEF